MSFERDRHFLLIEEASWCAGNIFPWGIFRELFFLTMTLDRVSCLINAPRETFVCISARKLNEFSKKFASKPKLTGLDGQCKETLNLHNCVQKANESITIFNIYLLLFLQ